MDRARFVVTRASLRILAARYLQTTPESLQVDYNAYGKPHFRATGERRLHFNVSHSGRLALLAFCVAANIGVDIERVRDVADAEEIMRRFFRADEAEAWARLERELRSRAFFDRWTRREAYLKAIGRGVASLAERFLDYQEDEWSFIDVAPSDEYAAAVAIKGRGWELQSSLFLPDRVV